MPAKKPKLGQNFLTSPAARRRIVESLGDISAGAVLEIGPGRGALTDLLAARARQLIAVELDRGLAPRITAAWAHAPHVRIIEADILTLDLAPLATQQKLVVVGNLPYYITSDILLHLFSQADSITRAVVMVQEEVADRLAAPSGSSGFGVLSATAQMHAHVEKLFTLPPEAFTPPPGVNSAVVRMDIRPRFQELQVERAPFLRFLQLCFHQKRKTLANNLRAVDIDPAQILPALQAANLDPAIRAEAVSLDTMAHLYRSLHNIPFDGLTRKKPTAKMLSS